MVLISKLQCSKTYILNFSDDLTIRVFLTKCSALADQLMTSLQLNFYLNIRN